MSIAITDAGDCRIEFGGVPCANPVASVWDASCVHEHAAADIGVCAVHETYAGRPWTCVRCEKSREPHACTVTPVRRPS